MTKHFRWVALALACGPAPAATGPDDSSGSSDPTGSEDSPTSEHTLPTSDPFSCEGLEPIPEDVFPERIAEAVCAQKAACGCTPGEMEMSQCQGWAQFFSDARAYAAENGRIYDGLCVARKLQVLAHAGCSQSDYEKIDDCGDCPIYISPIATGEPCEDGVFVDVAACADPNDYCHYGTCQTIAKEGELCPQGSYQCEAGTVCDGDAEICQSARAGEPCVLNLLAMPECAEGFWCSEYDLQCRSFTPIGAPCNDESECQDQCLDHVCTDNERVCSPYLSL